MGFARPRVDHIVLDTRDRMDDAVAAYRSLGFHLTERGRHTLGSINHLIVFESDYLELLGFDPAAGPVRADIAPFPVGLNGLVFATQATDILFRDLTARGVPVEEPVAFSRPLNLPGGSQDAKFRVVRLRKGAASFGRVYYCQHETPDLVWRPEWQRHSNGAIGLTRISIAAADPLVPLQLFHAMFGPASVERTAEGVSVLQAGNVAIELLPLETAKRQLGGAAPAQSGRSDFIAQITLRTASLAQTIASLQAGDVPFTSAGPGRIRVPARAALNVAIEFAE